MAPNATYIKCGGAMVSGFVMDQGHGIFHVSKWQRGEPRKSFWSGVKLSREQQFEVTTFRCDRCGYLESYALGSRSL